MSFDLTTFDIAKYDSILARGLCFGVGKQGQQVCIEAAICETLGMPHGDEPTCVASSVRAFKIRLNDSNWSNSAARAKGLRDLGIAQLGSLGVVNDREFASLLSKKLIQSLLPKLFRELFPLNKAYLAAADRCELEGTNAAASAAAYAISCAAPYLAYAASYAAAAAANAAANVAANVDAAPYAAANAASYAAAAASKLGDSYLILAASLALETLKELKSPGCSLL